MFRSKVYFVIILKYNQSKYRRGLLAYGRSSVRTWMYLPLYTTPQEPVRTSSARPSYKE